MKCGRLVFLTSVIFCIAGCDSERLSQFASFAAAGSLYVQDFHQLIAQASTALVAADSATLITARNMAGPTAVAQNAGQYSQELQKEDQLAAQNLVTLQMLDAQATLLGSYFSAITQLTNGNASSQMTTSADNLLDAINKLNPEVENAKIGGQPIKSFMQPAVNLVVAHFEVKALDEELQKAAPTIDKALTLQEAAVQAIATQLKADLGASLEIKESTDVINPYVSTAALPSDWAANRQAFLQADVAVVGAPSAQQAIKQLHNDFTQLVQDKNASIDFATLMSDLEKMSNYVGAVQSSTSTGGAK